MPQDFWFVPLPDTDILESESRKVQTYVNPFTLEGIEGDNPLDTSNDLMEE